MYDDAERPASLSVHVEGAAVNCHVCSMSWPAYVPDLHGAGTQIKDFLTSDGLAFVSVTYAGVDVLHVQHVIVEVDFTRAASEAVRAFHAEQAAWAILRACVRRAILLVRNGFGADTAVTQLGMSFDQVRLLLDIAAKTF